MEPTQLTIHDYHEKQAVCDECKIGPTQTEEQTGLMHCVCCPFCKQIVSAILTETTISCPNCKVTVKR